MCLTVNLHKDLAQMPPPVWICLHPARPFSPNLGGKQPAKPVPPEPNRLLADVDPALTQQVFDIAKRKRKTDLHHHSQADDFRRRLEVAKWRVLCLFQTLRNHPDLFKSVSFDTAPCCHTSPKSRSETKPMWLRIAACATCGSRVSIAAAIRSCSAKLL